MMKIISFVDSFKHYQTPIEEFLKRLSREVEFIKLKPSKRKEVGEIISEESKELLSVLEKTKGYKILLFINSKELSTEKFYDLIEEKKMRFADVIFIVGGAYGVDYDMIKDHIDMKLSLSPMTFPHAQAIMMLLEQIYRVVCMKKGVKYHHA